MKLQLKRPLVLFDIESTGLDPSKDRIVEIALIKVYPDGNEDSKCRRINPEMPIPPSSTAIHGIKDEDVKECPTFRTVAKSLAEFIADCDLAGYNSNKFDIPILAEEFMRVGVAIDFSNTKFVDVQNIFHKKEQRTLAAAHIFYCGSEIENAHSAMDDIRATYNVLLAQLERYDDLQGDIDFLSDYTRMSRNVDLAGRIVLNDKDQAVFAFGKHKGRPVTEVLMTEPSYYNWMMHGDFPYDTKATLTRIREANMLK